MRTAWVLAGLAALALPLQAQDVPRIEDNSFLVEEAYNQESGIVQHISTFSRAEGGNWEYTFTQEWPFLSRRHQLSYTIPVQRISAATGSGTKVGDIALNYRNMLLGINGENVALSPRFSLLLPTGNEETGHGAGGIRFQGNIPLSIMLAPRLVSHYNAGATYTPSARNPIGDEASTTSFHAGASVIYLVTSTFNLMVEGVWGSLEEVSGPALAVRSREAFINPGIRFAINTPSGLQIVPGVAYTIGVGPSEGESGLFLYLSLEHAFSQAGRQN